ncbi:hypothetical protein UFOVP1528_46 [uncultured Caudovirales phage]|uniref:Uncharacterized protein n=1 Tax=uncultured Caudovirales phage TaxID=2100421 RepID=A0A6J5PJ82_9CAUD|nr:hypothetical protein UFOVP905_30 [uncultured Caudovirales phage]CAB4182692.1 hypothetical protein UFOVP1080_17 [uncultured Caudovirales phage]CAB4197215.1 hypothetical protein UFOVP1321_5 [uncultured Caudovirales phage]CAB4212353.1 hypothetical protein UFOVP1432_9 [uncultured Caudovirales phage]CAB5227504.1 hypothetical protein UFOVP1528_46 [uncultured Caudovirales phage]
MKLTLLEMTQSILNVLESDEVNSISDTEESLMVANIVKESYFDLITVRDWPFLGTLTTLTALGDTDNPTKMRIPVGVNKIDWVKYNKKDVTFLEPKDFKDMIDLRNVADDNIDANGYITNRDPLYWTSYDDDYIYFDSYDITDDDTLYESKSSMFGYTIPTWTHVDEFIPLLPDKMFPTLLADAKGTAFLVLKQQGNSKEESKARKGKIRFQNEAWRNENGEKGSYHNINTGRK